MDPKQLSKQMFDFHKTVFERSFAAVVVMQDQAEKMFNMWMDQNPWFPAEGRKAMAEWVKTYKKNRDDFKARVAEGYEKLEEYLGPKAG
ncbi:MAG TPA: hypothetical protein PL061_13260 [Syntrophales bacterium]|nr:hypothetical protein [Syntrophales bacterium]HOM08365.1 hypothetical protein [Syntrophales bacterium]HOO00991.1 hypothetical protein [Syntrophales bacterium]HPC33918.1 hypothetical protein [Syntrophales bacterium]